MKANCVVCGKEFQKRGPAIACGPECRAVRKRQVNAAWHVKHYATNKKRNAENLRRWRKRNPEKVKAQQRRHDKKRKYNPQKSKEACRRWRAANPKKRREQNRRWRAANPKKANDLAREWYWRNVEKARRLARNAARVKHAAAALGVPPVLYAAIKSVDLFTSTKEKPHD